MNRLPTDKDTPPLSVLPQALWQWLQSKGIESYEEVDELMRASLKSLNSPFIIKDMEKAAKRIVESFEKQQSLCIYGDFDMDGTPAVAMLYKGFEKLGFKKLTYYQPSRLHEGYGLHAEAIHKLYNQGIELLITVDLGITAVKEAELAKTLGLDLIITDHHLPGSALPKAYAVVNPNQSQCSSQMGYLAGTGVAFYLLLAVKQVMKDRGFISDFNAKEYLDLFALGTLADMVPLKGDNRKLVRHGLVQLSKTLRPGLKELLKSLELWGRPLHSSDVAMKLAPSLNALSRLELDTRPIEILICDNEVLASQLAEQAKQTNLKRKELQQVALCLAYDHLALQPPENFVYVSSDKFHKGVIGLVATQLMQKYNLPAFVGAKINHKIVGSSRAPEHNSSLDLTHVLSTLSSPLNKQGGHKKAAGFELSIEKENVFLELLKQYFKNSHIEKEDIFARQKEVLIKYDVELNIDELNSTFMDMLYLFEPFGQNFSAPIFRIPKVPIVKLKILKGEHLKMVLGSLKNSQQWEALWFSPEKSQLNDLYEGALVDLIGEAQWNYFRGSRKLQILVKNLTLRH